MQPRALTMTALGTLLLVAVAAGHEGHEHTAMGTIESIDETQITLTLTDEGDEGIHSFKLTEETSFTRAEAEVSPDEAAVGERAVVIYETKDEVDVAIEVKLPPNDP